MTERRRLGGRTAALAALLALNGCGGGGSASGPAPAATSAPRQTTVLNAARGTLTIVLTALQTARYYEEFIRPGIGVAFGAIAPQTTPTCNAATHSAATSFANQTSTSTLVTTAFYPAKDATCSASPVRILVMQYAGAPGATQTGYGYQITFASPGDPVPSNTAGSIVAIDALTATIYPAAAGSANVIANVDPGGDFQIAGSSGGPFQPAPGSFPATFPTQLPPPPAPGIPFGIFFATAEQGLASASGVANLAGGYLAPPAFPGGFAGHVDSSDRYAVTATAQGFGGGSLAIVDNAPQFVTDVTNGPAPVVTPAYPFAAGTSVLGIVNVSQLGYHSAAATFPKPVAGAATYDAAGMPLACSDDAVDVLDGVEVRATCQHGGASIALTITDLLAKKSAISPATIVLDAYGYSDGAAPFTFAFDGSTDSIAGFALQ